MTCDGRRHPRTASRCAAARPARRVAPKPLHAATTERWAADPAVEVGEVFCLGFCALGPAGTLDDAVHARLTPDRLESLTRAWNR